MYTYDKITLEKALELESKGRITIIDLATDKSNYHSREDEWRGNLNQLRTKVRHIPSYKIPEHFNAQYHIELNKGCTSRETNTYEWKYLYGIPNNDLTRNTHSTEDSIEYVYALTNPGYPDLVKIGMTTKDPLKRVEQVNGTGTVDLWEVKFALPLKEGTSYKVEQQVHKIFNAQRFHARNLNDREMFKIDLFSAMDTIRKAGSLFQAGNPIIY